MNVRTVCLAILNFRDASGYEIKKLSTESHYSHFVDASFGSIYPALGKLEGEGLVTQREERQPGKPPRKVYSITETGRAELLDQLVEPPREDVFRSEFLMVAMCAHLLDRATVARAIDTNLAQMREKLHTVDEAVESEPDAPSIRWIGGFAHHCMRAHIDYLEAHRDELEGWAIQPAAETGAGAAPEAALASPARPLTEAAE